MADKKRVLFVCLGNICRSPLAEVVAKHRAEALNLSHHFEFASAGTGSWHIGNGADPRSADIARQYGLDLSRHRAQQVTARNINQWDWFVAMDNDNYANLLAMGVPRERTLLMRQFEDGADGFAPDVPDPYYGGPDGFEDAYRMLMFNADRILDYLSKV